MAYTFVMFDFDGTLADSVRWFGSVFNSVAAKYNFRQLSDAEMHAMRGNDAQTILREIGVSKIKLPFIAKHIRDLMNRDIQQIKLFAGIPELLQTLHEHAIKLGVVSSNSLANVKTVLGDQAHVIDFYECGVDMLGKHHKLQQGLKHSGNAAHETLYVGDEIRDSDAARHAQIDFAAVAWGYTLPEALQAQHPVALCHSVDELQSVILG